MRFTHNAQTHVECGAGAPHLRSPHKRTILLRFRVTPQGRGGPPPFGLKGCGFRLSLTHPYRRPRSRKKKRGQQSPTALPISLFYFPVSVLPTAPHSTQSTLPPRQSPHAGSTASPPLCHSSPLVCLCRIRALKSCPAARPAPLGTTAPYPHAARRASS